MINNPYLENMVANANPVRLVIMLYEKAINCLENALEIGDTEDFDMQKSKYEEIGRALEIISVLDAVLDMEKGGEIAKNLREIYRSLTDELTYQMLKEDKERLEKVIKILKNLKSAWEEVERIHYGKAQKVAPGV
ncbi:flagellar biosynthesis protein FliS [Thermocrinis ruber]|uniref:Flagellar secretion chaperone FliS n=1 Tax=Thermocrinis ruber TaxID=75906 RepID=W0DET6_9AQUI|nr:flagellar export chaperone FliS [Thermocrinis ruber]AHE95420.1 flagellar biosynthesis protein FliS [Thermocrinis ruber]